MRYFYIKEIVRFSLPVFVFIHECPHVCGRMETRVWLPVVRWQHVDIVEDDTVEVDQFLRRQKANVHQRSFVEDVRERLSTENGCERYFENVQVVKVFVLMNGTNYLQIVKMLAA